MHSYVALVGHQPLLTRAELSCRFADISFGDMIGADWLPFSTKTEITQPLFDTLGGTVLIARRLDTQIKNIDRIPELLCQEVNASKGKIVFGLRCHGIERSVVRDLLRDCKKSLARAGHPSRYTGNEREPAKAVQLHDEGMLDTSKGVELTILKVKDYLWVGRTVAAQNIKAYTARDMGKPVRDTTVGLLPPKLAQIMLNFGEFLVRQKRHAPPDDTSHFTVFDPFCGTGVIPLESLLRGWNTLASDREMKAVNGCRKNIEWLRKTYKIFKKNAEDEVWKHDATLPFSLSPLPDVIVTEGSLGPALKSRPLLKNTEKLVGNAETLAESFLANCRQSLPGVPIVMMWPVWYTQKRPVFLTRVLKRCHDVGYRPVLPPHIQPSVAGRISLIYRRSDQFVGREILFLSPIA